MSNAMYRLTDIHRSLDEQINHELKRRAPDHLRLLRLKKLKLSVKDRLNRLVPRAAHG